MPVCTKIRRTIKNQNGLNQLLNLLFENEHRISWDPGSLMCNDDDYDNGNDDRVLSSINLGRTQQYLYKKVDSLV